jgi:hypothetical protein
MLLMVSFQWHSTAPGGADVDYMSSVAAYLRPMQVIKFGALAAVVPEETVINDVCVAVVSEALPIAGAPKKNDTVSHSKVQDKDAGDNICCRCCRRIPRAISATTVARNNADIVGVACIRAVAAVDGPALATVAGVRMHSFCWSRSLCSTVGLKDDNTEGNNKKIRMRELVRTRYYRVKFAMYRKLLALTFVSLRTGTGVGVMLTAGCELTCADDDAAVLPTG